MSVTTPVAHGAFSGSGEPRKPQPLRVIKRNGARTHYSAARIRDAIRPAWARGRGEPVPADALADIVAAVDRIIHARYAVGDHTVEVREIEAIVEQTLTDRGLADVAETYTAYRMEKARRRAEATSIEHQVGRLLAKDAGVVNENANRDGRTFAVQNFLLAGSVAKAKALASLPERIATAHTKGQIHYHDLDMALTASTNCCVADFAGMLRDGFTMGNARVETPKSVGTAATVLSQAMSAVAASQYGGVSVDRVDELLAPYAKKTYDKHRADAARWLADDDAREQFAREHTTKDIYDACQTLEYQINTIFSSAVGQVPFTTLGFGLGEDWFAREIQKAILKVRMAGLGADGRTAIFPKLLFTVKNGLNASPGDPNHDILVLATQCTAKRIYPDYLSYEGMTALTGTFVTAMGCRSHPGLFVDEDGNQVNTGRMNLGVITLNLPRIALETRDDKTRAAFWRLLDERLDLCHEGLAFREAWVRRATPENAPILYMEGGFGKRLKPGDDVGTLFDNGRATISLGFIGLHEVASVFFGPRWQDDPEAKAFTVEIVKRMKAATTRWNEQDFNGSLQPDGTRTKGARYSLYCTPSESLTDRFARIDAETWGEVEPDVCGKGWYTNSFHLDSRLGEKDGWDPFRKIDFEVEYPAAGATGGFIHYVEVPAIRDNPQAVETLVSYAMQAGAAYFGVNTKVDHCLTCGFEGECAPTEDSFVCPRCGEDDAARLDVTRRVCGYLSQPVVRKTARGRHLEVTHRSNHVSDPSALPVVPAQGQQP